ncbi:response regulator [Gilvimarinus sp. SDUM040013]|uniref:Response regulator n=1 Tax=Gilvimarinus gilvus TaxID=3058038 RepID=A0ABU4RXZ0_9GAMM|nr:response regulator [Gilvimarinus sp. SDUM040013]MDO3386240.1 response regulator [Gilvimarinus sp. SDUM040013]MDX6849765.1 response regulator [Gilvimarinus sp. SDUM040013]
MELIGRPIFDELLCSALQHWRNHHNLFSKAGKLLPSKEVVSASYRSATVLVVDDHFINQEVIRGMLESMGLLVAVARDGQEAIDILQKSGSDLAIAVVFMDCQMPVMNGYEATEAIRRGDAGSAAESIPIVALTAGAMEGERQRCLDVGMTDYLSKPIDVQALVHVLDRYLERADTAQPPDSKTPTDTSDDSAGDSAAANALSANAAQASTATPVHWDRSAALARLANNETILNKIVTMYIESSQENVQKLEAGAATSDREAVKHEAHTLKGISSNVGAVFLVALARELEQGAHELDTKDIERLVQQVKSAHRELLVMLQEYLDQAA